METFNGLQAPNAFQQLLYSATDLTNEQHSLTIANAGPLSSTNAGLIWFDIDWITYEQSFPAPTDSSPSSSLALNTTTFSASDTTAFSFLPSVDQWTASTFVNDVGTAITTRTTTTTSASASINFTLPSGAGSAAVGIFGALDTTHGIYQVTLSELSPSTSKLVDGRGFSGTYGYNTVHEQMLFYQEGLTPGASYALSVSDASSGTNATALSIEYVRTWSLGEGSVVMVPST